MKPRFAIPALAATLLLAFSLSAHADSPTSLPTTSPAPTKYLRWVGDDSSGQLQAAIVPFVNDKGVRVDLISAVHVADHAFFAALNDRFKSYDAVLYEMVKPAGMAPPLPGQKTASGVSSLQRFIKDQLALDFQLDAVDYRAKNFVHADLDAETFQAMEDQRGESIFLLMLESMLDQLTNPQAVDPNSRLANLTFTDLLQILSSPDRPRLLKLLIAPEFGDIDKQLAVLQGPDGSVILTERNKAALKVLQSQIAKGRKHLAIFYGAAHMHDMSTRLEEMGFHPTGQPQWLTAWNMPPHPPHPATTQPASAE